MISLRSVISALLLVLPLSGLAADPVLAPNAPKDRVIEQQPLSDLDRAIAPYVAKARATYPQAKQRFLKGLPAGQFFFVTTRLRDGYGNVEQVFIAVQSIQNGQVRGKVWSDIVRVRGFRAGDLYAFPEGEMLDWLITKPDGSEEGNLVGKFLDTYHG